VAAVHLEGIIFVTTSEQSRAKSKCLKWVLTW